MYWKSREALYIFNPPKNPKSMLSFPIFFFFRKYVFIYIYRRVRGQREIEAEKQTPR